MRSVTSLNDGWIFYAGCDEKDRPNPADLASVSLPHTAV